MSIIMKMKFYHTIKYNKMKHIIDIIHQKLLKALDLFDSPLMLLGSYHLAQIKDFLGIVGLGITIAYTLWKWKKEWKEIKIKK